MLLTYESGVDFYILILSPLIMLSSLTNFKNFSADLLGFFAYYGDVCENDGFISSFPVLFYFFISCLSSA